MRTLFLIGCLLFSPAVAWTQQAAQPAKPFVPTVGQAGKDVVWVPTPAELVTKMMEVAKVTPKDFVMDLGSGDGRNIIAAARLGARGRGVEYNPDMVALSRRLAAEAGVADKAEFVEGDMYEADVSKATVLALFLLPVNLNKLMPKFQALPPGTRIVGNTFGFDGWEPDYRETLSPSSDCSSWCEALLWIVPARVAGTWQMSGGSITLTQENQMVQGTVTAGSASQTVTAGRLRGDQLSFVAGGLTYTGKVTSNSIDGTIATPTGTTPWRATRK